METPLVKTSFEDRPGTRMRVVMAKEVRPRGWTRSAFAWLFKFVYVVAASGFCVALLMFAPTGGPAIRPFVPAESMAFIHLPSGAALHQALLNSAPFNELLDDPDTGDFAGTVHAVPAPRTDDDESPPPNTLRGQLDRAFDVLDKQPWYLQWLLPAEAPSLARIAGFYPLIGGECAVALVERKEDASANPLEWKHSREKGVLIFLRVSGSKGHLVRLGAAVFHPKKNVEIFDLGGGLMAIGFNGARPAFEPHAPPMVVSAFSDEGPTPLIRAAYSSKAPAPRKKEEFPDTTNPSLAQLFEDGVPDKVLQALQTPPNGSEMLNCKAPPVLTRVSVFASPEGMISVRGRIEGDVPPLPARAANGDAIAARNTEPFTEFSAPDVVADLVLPVDLRACFLWHVAGGMKLDPNVYGRTKGQRSWIQRFNALANERVDLDKDLWPAFGHAAVLEIHAPEANTGTGLGKVKLWMPFRATAETVHALTALARARWIWVIEQGDTLEPKPLNYVTHFHSGNGDSFVLSDKINAPAWNVGPKGFRLVSDAGYEAVRDGPRESSFPVPPTSLDAYRLRLDGPRMASTVESYEVYDYDERMEELGPQKFVDQCPHRDRDVRLARKWSSLIGRFELEIAPDTTGADVRLNWRPASLNAAVSRDAPTPAKETKESKKEKKVDDDDVPPPPPGN